MAPEPDFLKIFARRGPVDSLGELVEAVARGVRALTSRPPPDLSACDLALWRAWRAVALNNLAVYVDGTRPVREGERRGNEGEWVWWRLPLARALAEHWRLTPRDRVALQRYVRETQDKDLGWAKIRVMLEALAIVQGERAGARRVRIGRTWVADGSPIIPVADLSYLEYLRWFVAQSLREARALLRQEEPSQHKELTDNAASPAALSDDEAVPEAASRWKAMLAAASPRQRRLLDRWLEEPDASLAEIARQLGMKPNAAHQAIDRLRRKLA